jgi:hypothetical protein
MPTRTVDAQINYLTPGSFINRRFVAPGVEANTGSYKPYPVKVADARTVNTCFSLNGHGFVLAEHKSIIADFLDKEKVNTVYDGEMVETVKHLTGASHVAAMGWMVRTAGELATRHEKTVGYTHRGGIQPPAGEAHVDFTPSYAETLATNLFAQTLPGEKPYRRFIATSLWRGFSPPPQDWPLAVCDGNSVGWDEGTPNSLIVVDEIPDREGMLAEIHGEDKLPSAAIFGYNPDHQWWYYSNMHRDEVLLFKFHDSDETCVRRTPHTAFFDSSFPGAHIRQSIEYRSVAYFVD